MKKECLESMEWVAQSSEFEKSIARAQQILDRDDMRVATVTGRQPSETLCIAKGFGDNSFAVCTNSDYIYIMRVVDSATVDAALRCLNNLRDDPTAPQCETGLLDRWVDGELLCYTPCEDDTYQHFDSEGRQWCHSPPECGTQLIAVYVSSINRYNCGETEEMAEQFWQYAFQTLGISEEDRKARWIGGFAKTYNRKLYVRDRVSLERYIVDGGVAEEYESDETLDIWGYADMASYHEFMGRASAGTALVHICYDHDCDREGNLVGSTSAAYSSCRAFVWHSQEGIWFVMRIDEAVSICVDAYKMTTSERINGASASSRSWEEQTGSQVKDGIERPIFYNYGAELEEITLTGPTNKYEYDSGPADNNTWVAAIDLR